MNTKEARLKRQEIAQLEDLAATEKNNGNKIRLQVEIKRLKVDFLNWLKPKAKEL